MSSEESSGGGGGLFGGGFDVSAPEPEPSFEQFLLMQAANEDETLPPMYTSTVIRVPASPENEAHVTSNREEDEKQRSSSMDSAESSSSHDSDRDSQQQQPTKKLKYDKLGRLTAVEEIKPVVPLASSLAAGAGSNLKRPRGRPPKGKIWDDKRGWIDEGLGLGPRRKLY